MPKDEKREGEYSPAASDLGVTDPLHGSPATVKTLSQAQVPAIAQIPMHLCSTVTSLALFSPAQEFTRLFAVLSSNFFWFVGLFILFHHYG